MSSRNGFPQRLSATPHCVIAHVGSVLRAAVEACDGRAELEGVQQRDRAIERRLRGGAQDVGEVDRPQLFGARRAMFVLLRPNTDTASSNQTSTAPAEPGMAKSCRPPRIRKE